MIHVHYQDFFKCSYRCLSNGHHVVFFTVALSPHLFSPWIEVSTTMAKIHPGDATNTSRLDRGRHGGEHQTGDIVWGISYMTIH